MFNRRGLPVLVTLLVATQLFGAEQRLKVEGTWDGERFQVQRVKQRDPEKDSARIRISGTVSDIDAAARTLRIGPAALHWNPEQDAILTPFEPGQVVEVDAHQLADGDFLVDTIEPDNLDAPESLELIGSVTASEREGAGSRIELAGIPTWVPNRLYSNGRIRLQRLDEKRPLDQFTVELGPTRLTVGGDYELVTDYEADRDLDGNEEDRALESETGAQLEAFLEYGDTISAFFELVFESGSEFEVPVNRTESEHSLRRGESWVFFDQPFDLPVGLQFGRQNFAEEREWWWDEDLDAARIFYNSSSFGLDFAVADELAPESLAGIDDEPEDQDIFRVLGSAYWKILPALDLQTFFLHQRDHSAGLSLGDSLADEKSDEEDANLSWYGLRAAGEFAPAGETEVRYWIDSAVVRGDEIRYGFEDTGVADIVTVDEVSMNKRHGWAWDAGGSVGWDGRLKPTVTAGYAVGSGNSSGDGNFRQTHLNDNNDKFNGVDRFRYYGELARPELSNIGISTLAFGIRLGTNSSLELLHHTYEQQAASPDHGLRLDMDANGTSKKLGEEFDVVLGLEEWVHLELEFVGALFRPGPALNDADSAWLATFKMNYNF